MSITKYTKAIVALVTAGLGGPAAFNLLPASAHQWVIGAMPVVVGVLTWWAKNSVTVEADIADAEQFVPAKYKAEIEALVAKAEALLEHAVPKVAAVTTWAAPAVIPAPPAPPVELPVVADSPPPSGGNAAPVAETPVVPATPVVDPIIAAALDGIQA